MSEMNVKQFIEAARQYFFGMMPVPQPALVAIPVGRAR